MVARLGLWWLSGGIAFGNWDGVKFFGGGIDCGVCFKEGSKYEQSAAVGFGDAIESRSSSGVGFDGAIKPKALERCLFWMRINLALAGVRFSEAR